MHAPTGRANARRAPSARRAITAASARAPIPAATKSRRLPSREAECHPPPLRATCSGSRRRPGAPEKRRIVGRSPSNPISAQAPKHQDDGGNQRKAAARKRRVRRNQTTSGAQNELRGDGYADRQAGGAASSRNRQARQRRARGQWSDSRVQAVHDNRRGDREDMTSPVPQTHDPHRREHACSRGGRTKPRRAFRHKREWDRREDAGGG